LIGKNYTCIIKQIHCILEQQLTNKYIISKTKRRKHWIIKQDFKRKKEDISGGPKKKKKNRQYK
jgi:hypothetical protein